MKKTILIATLLTACSVTFASLEIKQATSLPKIKTSETSNKMISATFLQSAKAASIKTIDSKKSEYLLTLKEVHPYVTILANRPNRSTGILPINTYMHQWDKGAKPHFATNPPNIALESFTGNANNKPVHVLGTITRPNYDESKHEISYRLHVIGNNNSNVSDNTKLGYTVLFIDDASICWGTGGYGNGGGC